MEQILKKLNKALTRATIASATNDEDAWYLAMHNLRALAWEGKEIIHRKRLAAAPQPARVRANTALADLSTLGISPSDLLEALKTVQQEGSESPDANTLDVSSSSDG